MNELSLNRVNFDIISLKWKCVAQVHIFLGLSNTWGLSRLRNFHPNDA